MNILRQFGVFIGWLSASIAAISAALYAFGYLITVSHLHFLGLDVSLFQYDPLFYLQRGASFFAYLFALGNEIAIKIVPMLLVAGLVTFVVWSLARRADQIGHKIFPAIFRAHYPMLRRSAGYLLLLGISLFLLSGYEQHSKPLEHTNLLHIRRACPPAGQDATSAAENVPIPCLVIQNQTAVLLTKFVVGLVALVVAVIISTVASLLLTDSRRFRVVLLLPFLLVAITYAFLIPRIYAILILSPTIRYPIINIETNNHVAPKHTVYYLLNKTAQELVLWDAHRREIVLLPARSLASARIGQPRTIAEILSRPCGGSSQ